MANKNKKCKWCDEYVEASTGVQTPAGFFCCFDHAIKFANDRGQKKAAREQKQVKFQRRKVFADNDRNTQLSLAQKAINEFIRLRDKDEPCISCGRHHTGQYHAGHYRSVGAAPHLRFNIFNIHKQCSACNNHKSGNAIEYRINLVKKIGVEKVEWIESQNKALKLSIQDIRAIKFYYRKMVKLY